MNIEKCFELLKVPRGSSFGEIKQSYRDLVSVWHPDRFSHNARLKKKAEEELKAINLAYQEILQFQAKAETGHSPNMGWESRLLCRDGHCIGIIDKDGRCTECGKTLEGSGHDGPDFKGEPMDFENRILCSDENCIGIIGSNGRCTECGRCFA